MSAPICPYCGQPMDYIGVADGGGDYGSSICDEFECSCGNVIEMNCIETEDDDEDYEMWASDDDYAPDLPPDMLVDD